MQILIIGAKERFLGCFKIRTFAGSKITTRC